MFQEAVPSGYNLTYIDFVVFTSSVQRVKKVTDVTTVKIGYYCFLWT